MSAFTVGSFEVDVWDNGYPIWTSITHNGVTIRGIGHAELADLKYAVDKAIKLAKLELKKSNSDDEV